GLLEVGARVGAAELSDVGPKLQFHETDVALVVLMTGGGAVSGGRWAAKAARQLDVPGVQDSAGRDKETGGYLLGGALGLWAGLATSQLVDLTPGELAMTGFASAVVGTGAAGI